MVAAAVAGRGINHRPAARRELPYHARIPPASQALSGIPTNPTTGRYMTNPRNIAKTKRYNLRYSKFTTHPRNQLYSV
jgi:hypothetical protein